MSKNHKLKLNLKIHGKVILKGIVAKNSISSEFITYLRGLFAGFGQPIKGYIIVGPLGQPVQATVSVAEQTVDSFTVQISANIIIPPQNTVTLLLYAILQDGSKMLVSTVTTTVKQSSTILPIEVNWLLTVGITMNVSHDIIIVSNNFYNLLLNLFTGKWTKVSAPSINCTTRAAIKLDKNTTIIYDTAELLVTFNPIFAILNGYFDIPITVSTQYLGTTVLVFDTILFLPPAFNIYTDLSVQVSFT